MVNNQDTETGGNVSGETPGGEQQSAETASTAGTIPAEGSSETAQPESGWDTSSAGTGQSADAPNTAGSSEKPADSGTPSAPTGAQLSPNAPRTVKKPADMKPIESAPSAPSAATSAG